MLAAPDLDPAFAAGLVGAPLTAAGAIFALADKGPAGAALPGAGGATPIIVCLRAERAAAEGRVLVPAPGRPAAETGLTSALAVVATLARGRGCARRLSELTGFGAARARAVDDDCRAAAFARNADFSAEDLVVRHRVLCRAAAALDVHVGLALARVERAGGSFTMAVHFAPNAKLSLSFENPEPFVAAASKKPSLVLGAGLTR
jgi:hypothetical protein